MSQATARQTRREIRRAVGVNGLEAVNNTTLEVYQHILPTIQQHEAVLAALIPLLQRDGGFVSLEGETAILRRSFLGRLRWFLLGR